MANRFLVAGGTGNWDSTTNWSATDGGASGASAPVLGDAVLINSNSGNANLTVNVSSACTSLVVSGTYTGTLTFNAQLTVSGTITFISGMTLAGTTGPLVPNSTATLTSGGKTIPCPLTFGISATYTLADNWTVTGLMTAGVTTGSTTLNGFQITCAGGYHQGGTTATVIGTTKLVITGGTWDSSSSIRTGNAIDLSGNVTVSGTVVIGAGTLTYLSGTITTTGSTLTIANTGTVNTSGVTWNNVTLSGSAQTYTFSSTFSWSGTLAVSNSNTLAGVGSVSGTGAISVTAGVTLTVNNTGGITTTGTMTLPNGNVTFAGSAGWTVGTLTNTSYTTSRTVTLTFGNTYTVTTSILNVGTTAAIRQAFVSSVPGSKVVFNVTAGATEALLYADPTDIDSSGGAQVTSINGTITTSLNWTNNVNTAPAATTTLVNCMITQHTDSYA